MKHLNQAHVNDQYVSVESILVLAVNFSSASSPNNNPPTQQLSIIKELQ